MICDRSGHSGQIASLVFLLLVLPAPDATQGADAQGLESVTVPSSRPLVFAGSGTNLAITRLLAEAFARRRPDIKIEVPASIGTTGGIRAAADGAVTVGLVSRPLRELEKALGLTVLPYARTAVVIGAHPTVADDGITSTELVQIYQGAKTRWRDGHEIIGVPPTPENMLGGRYRLVKTLAFVFVKGKLPAAAKAFIDFVRSRDGEKILRAYGYVPGK